jgi:putative ABC transport system permease protein
VLSILTLVLSGIAAISLLVGGIGIMNIMLVTVTERTKEIGLLKAIGAKRKDILMQFLIEAVVLTVVGGAIGIVLGIGIGFLIANAIHVPFGLPIIPVIASVSISIIIGVAFGSYPAYRASKLSPIDALHYE